MLIGILIGIGICLVLFLCAFLGYKLGNKPKKETLTEEELRKQREREEGFKNIMDYDYSKALERR